MSKLDQNKTPYLDALKKYVSEDVLPLDVPGHHMGNVSNKLFTIDRPLNIMPSSPARIYTSCEMH